ncbi:hypothetical protein DPMN_032145 [Dreissena polymorpha]|uniref:Uncharacterized protein n=2 Tax=Dreissena polymorpha TaxID=45954 RepID=A0A9D4M375_DREPO|nr:hypothetical protein DPMN_032145 [Dreissena polymorpha]
MNGGSSIKQDYVGELPLPNLPHYGMDPAEHAVLTDRRIIFVSIQTNQCQMEIISRPYYINEHEHSLLH